MSEQRWTPQRTWEDDRAAGRPMAVMQVWRVEGPAPFGGLRCRNEEHCAEVCERLNAMARAEEVRR